MSTAPNARIPELTLGWRLQMALGSMPTQEMADALGVSRATVSRWMHDSGAPPRRAFIVQWALLTDVSVEWLETGEGSAGRGPSPDGTHGPAALSALTRRKASRARGAGDSATAGYVGLAA